MWFDPAAASSLWQVLLTPADLYCDRTGPGLWSGPVSALTNPAFIAAGLWGVREGSRGVGE
ncbi:hypothetical protein FJ432_25535 [Mesorhizobium sp. B2-6-5]|nr:hypothetical protein FJ432_25535 [Mesorhizobium sp. B2-6-5]